MDTGFLGSWQGIIIAAIVSSAVIALIFLLLKKVDAIKGLRVTKDGVHFEQADLSNAIPRIDANIGERYFNQGAGLYRLFKILFSMPL